MRFSNDTLLGRVVRLPLRLVPRQLDVPVLSGPTRGMRWRVGSSTHGCWLGTYESEKVKTVLDAIRPGATVFDVGANAGFYTLAFSRRVGERGRVFAFEPFAENVVNLRHHLERNRVQNCVVVQCALSSGEAFSGFRPGPSNSMGALSSEAPQLQIPTASIDRLIADGIVAEPQVVKMDVEGAEAEVLAGATKLLAQGRAIWFIALHGEAAKRGCDRILKEQGYSLFDLAGQPISAPLASLPLDEIRAEKVRG